ncbi:MAG: hypothetical protein BAJALOKI2v1_520008 [Promethearchaeota archaeon]|nr:MAG: hypothetical protein BAJALOKI2v1_520008 [Candidatus Lokiarchaeota archaeon]
MEKDISIKKIFKIFKHSNKDYVLFSTTHSDFIYLYFSENNKRNRSLLYGKHTLLQIVLDCLNTKSNDCIECKLGSEIEGALSLDGGDLIHSNISINEANGILKSLKTKVKKKNLIRLF